MTEELEVTLAAVRQETAFLEKYFGLRKRCEQMQQANEKMVNRLQHVKKIIKRQRREKRYLEAKLAEYGDTYKDSHVAVGWEEDQLYHCMKTEKSEVIEEKRQSALTSVQPYLHGCKKDGRMKVEKTQPDTDLSIPKKPMNVFQLFCKDKKPLIEATYLQEHNEEIAHHELTRRLAQQWHVISQEDKKVYYNMYDKENEKYCEEVKAYERQKQNDNQLIFLSNIMNSTAKIKKETD